MGADRESELSREWEAVCKLRLSQKSRPIQRLALNQLSGSSRDLEPKQKLKSVRGPELSQGLGSVRRFDPNRRSDRGLPRKLEASRDLWSVYESESPSPSVTRKGFTLIEIVVTLCIVAILTAIAIPGFRKATEDFRLNSTLEDTVDILKACRNYYLIFNEFPLDSCDSVIPNRLRLFVPHRLINTATGKWNALPLGNKAYSYDIDNWMGNTSNKQHSIGISLCGIRQNTADWNKCYNKFKSRIGERYITPWSVSSYYMICLLPECPGSTDHNRNTTWENRYY
ncbi:MAG: prepilin-type N-terminal cleavage/methylation domain-containing protein [Puniceicoccales bacterium]|nr:prepilin-type N-terminal cleavage/methylation domain-containing protein [Puniceicoccales bacterium]